MQKTDGDLFGILLIGIAIAAIAVDLWFNKHLGLGIVALSKFSVIVLLLGLISVWLVFSLGWNKWLTLGAFLSSGVFSLWYVSKKHWDDPSMLESIFEINSNSIDLVEFASKEPWFAHWYIGFPFLLSSLIILILAYLSRDKCY